MDISIKELKKQLENCDIENLDNILNKYQYDERKGVQDLIKRFNKVKEDYNKEIIRLENMSYYEKFFYQKGVDLIAGIDEVGRGPLAGPVVCAAVILPPNIKIFGINDSKKLSSSRRKELYEIIKENAKEIQVSVTSNEVIDEINILNATIKSMEECVNNFLTKPKQLIIDAVKLPNISIPQLSIFKADEKSISVAAASIIAKFTRDKIMEQYSEVYPQYYFDKNKGYGTKEHIEAIRLNGPSLIHRKTFLRKFNF